MGVVTMTLCVRVCHPPEEGASGPKTPLELMAEMRDYKRRRQSYRAKNVHITKKSYTEVPAGGAARLGLALMSKLVENYHPPDGTVNIFGFNLHNLSKASYWTIYRFIWHTC